MNYEPAQIPSSGNGPESTQMLQEIRFLKDRIEALESRSSIVTNPVQHEPLTHSSASLNVTLHPMIRWCNFESYKNYFGDGYDAAVIDVLRSNEQLKDEVRQELSQRDLAKRGKFDAALVPDLSLFGNEESRIQSIRIKSKIILLILARISAKYGLYHMTVDLPVNFPKPFNYLIFSLEELKAEIGRLSVTPEEMAILKCYVDFMEQHVMPRYKQLAFGDATGNFSKIIHFDDLWWLYKPGDLLYMAPILQIGKPRPSTEQRIWRLYKVTDNDGEWNLDDIEREHFSSLGKKEDKDDTAKRVESKQLILWCYYLDYTGTTLCPVFSKIPIYDFAGEIEMSSLKAYPLRFVPGQKDITAKLRAERSNFIRYTSTKPRLQVTHEGWSVAKNVEGWDISSKDVRHEYIDSEVIVDFEESFQMHPSWKPAFFWSHIREQPRTKWKMDSFPVIHWHGGRQRWDVKAEQQDLFLVKSGVNSLEANTWVAQDRFLVLADYAEGSDIGNGIGSLYEHSATPLEPPNLHTELSDDEILLLPIRLFVYSLRNRKFFQIDIRNLKEIEQVQDPFKSLQIDPLHKDTVESLLYNHFDRKTLDRRPGPAIPDQDLIRGKGRGVIILLHGAPGVGKTATAEAVAQKHGKPLFSISCGDLGYEPDKVESALEDIFRLAQVWDCILLLDEADVFLTQRFPNDLQRNAMVSMILRILEYYKGVLFLTTNRPGVLDEALKSRVHVSLHYPSLDLEKSREIFRINLERLVLIEQRRNEKSQEQKLIIFEQEILDYATTHFQRYGPTGLGSWNGRQIRNAFQVASSFARYDGTKVPEAQAQLRASHFEKVAAMMYTYDEFRKQTLRKGDLEQAKSLGLRDDTYGIQSPSRPPEINIQGQHYGPGPGVIRGLHSQSPHMQQRGYTPYAPGPSLSGYSDYISSATRAGVSPQSGPPHHQGPAQGGYSGPSTYER
ncbi:hypothetical protein E8E14_014566 [Neopestalotiopsis sp. 37M]|nr:hypothetical protein E8E14_014566 [Neopestalotiopsis sp. 37M]